MASQYKSTAFVQSEALRRASHEFGLFDARPDLEIHLDEETWRFGQEHEVWRISESSVLKATYRGLFGCLPWGGNATPTQYLTRQKLCNELFDDCIELVSVTEVRGLLRLLTIQPFIEGVSPEQIAIDSFISGLGFFRNEGQGGAPALWTAPCGNSEIVIGDLHTGNAICGRDGEIIVIDGIVAARPCEHTLPEG